MYEDVVLPIFAGGRTIEYCCHMDAQFLRRDSKDLVYSSIVAC